jgi:hypothetical protein
VWPTRWGRLVGSMKSDVPADVGVMTAAR